MFSNKYVVNAAIGIYCTDVVRPPRPTIYWNAMMMQTKITNRPQLKIDNTIGYGLESGSSAKRGDKNTLQR